MLIDYVPIVKAQTKNKAILTIDLKIGDFARSIIYLVGPLAFYVKKQKMGVCSFKFDSSGFVRRSKSEAEKVLWHEVNDIHVLTSGYLVDLGKTAVPLPFRCFNKQQAINFEQLVQNKLRRYSW